MYLVSEGELEIVVDGHVINHAVRGDSFGARRLLRAERHSATVRATGAVALLSLACGETLFSAGDEDDRYLVVLHGEIEIIARGEQRCVLAPGDSFGEIAVLHGVARTTSTVGRTPARLVALSGQELREWLADYTHGRSPDPRPVSSRPSQPLSIKRCEDRLNLPSAHRSQWGCAGGFLKCSMILA